MAHQYTNTGSRPVHAAHPTAAKGTPKPNPSANNAIFDWNAARHAARIPCAKLTAAALTQNPTNMGTETPVSHPTTGLNATPNTAVSPQAHPCASSPTRNNPSRSAGGYAGETVSMGST